MRTCSQYVNDEGRWVLAVHVDEPASALDFQVQDKSWLLHHSVVSCRCLWEVDVLRAARVLDQLGDSRWRCLESLVTLQGRAIISGGDVRCRKFARLLAVVALLYLASDGHHAAVRSLQDEGGPLSDFLAEVTRLAARTSSSSASSRGRSRSARRHRSHKEFASHAQNLVESSQPQQMAPDLKRHTDGALSSREAAIEIISSSEDNCLSQAAEQQVDSWPPNEHENEPALLPHLLAGKDVVLMHNEQASPHSKDTVPNPALHVEGRRGPEEGNDEPDAAVVADLPRPVDTSEQNARHLTRISITTIAKQIQQAMRIGRQNILVICGAGVSTACGIPDFRSSRTGLYSQGASESLFTLSYFRENPAPFYAWFADQLRQSFKPSITHLFVKLLHDKGALQRCYTQNIDGLDLVPKGALVMAHGSLHQKAHVVDTVPKKIVSIGKLKKAVLQGEEGWRALQAECGGLVKPAIAFYGERLSSGFRKAYIQDCRDETELLLVLGTSLSTSWTVSLVQDSAPRHAVSINLQELEAPGCCKLPCLLTDIEAASGALIRELGWEAELQQLLQEGQAAKEQCKPGRQRRSQYRRSAGSCG
eukprot:TRINITY_DN32257_c0_g1_i1.p1 TRINITY_DN32257_c0_g1~~TRINITY_DN32257_c0_g1_i1.p1  ORF type:complete len:591 (-),score=77.96 TRINITY_DN32257_c0_g1_i1:221-1993(-)